MVWLTPSNGRRTMARWAALRAAAVLMAVGAAGAIMVVVYASLVIFAVNTTSSGTLTATASETNPPTANFDNVQVNSGVTVQSPAPFD